MRTSRWSSLLNLTLLAFVAVLLPLVLALGNATLAVDRLARSAERATLTAARTVSLSRSLSEKLTAMERHARQHQVLGDPALRELYEARRAEFVATADELGALAVPTELRPRLRALITEERAVHQALAVRPRDTPEHEAAVEAFAALDGTTRGLLGEASLATADAASAIQQQAAELQERMLWQGAWVVPLVIVLLVGAVVAIVRPLRTLDDAVRRIGAGELEAPVEIRGPADLRELGARLDWLRLHLRALEADRSRLFQHVSHELKTPLTSLREGTQLLVDGVAGALSPEQREITDILQVEAAELQRRIEDLLRLSELRTSDGASLQRREVQLDAVVAAVVEEHRVAARSRALVLDAVVEPITARVDAPRVRTIADNLLGNAVKFSPRGGTVRVRLEQVGPGARLSVEDEGPGFDPAERERVFEPFFQGRATSVGHVKGTGLGLTIAREYARAHGGDLAIEDARRGARVIVHLPIEETSP